MADVTGPAGLPLWSDHTAFVRRHALWILVLMTVGLGVGFAWSLHTPSTYSATTSVALTPVPKYVTPSTTELVSTEVTIDTDAQLLMSPTVLEPVAAALGTTTAVAAERISVTASPNSHVLHVTVESRSRDLAAKASQAAADQLLILRGEVLGALRGDQLRQLETLITAQEELLAKEQTKSTLLAATDELFQQVLELRRGLDELQDARAETGVVLQPAEPPVSANYSNTEVPTVSGAMLGLLCACGLGALWDARRRFEGPAASVLARLSELTLRFPALSDRFARGTIHLQEDHHHA